MNALYLIALEHSDGLIRDGLSSGCTLAPEAYTGQRAKAYALSLRSDWHPIPSAEVLDSILRSARQDSSALCQFQLRKAESVGLTQRFRNQLR